VTEKQKQEASDHALHPSSNQLSISSSTSYAFAGKVSLTISIISL